MKRGVWRAISLIAVGAGLNVIVAWGCALAPWNPEPKGQALVDWSDPWARDVGWPAEFRSAQAREYAGVGVRMYEVFLLVPASASRMFKDYDSLPELWSQSVMVEQQDGVVTRCGWPVVSLQTEAINTNATTGDPRATWLSAESHRHGLVFRLRDGAQRVLPTGVILGGAAINTVFYAVAVWTVVAGPKGARRWSRRRRGECRECGYPLGGEICPECGTRAPA